MAGDQDQTPRNTREFVALWDDAVEAHLVHQLAEALPGLVRESGPGDSVPAAALARHLVRALRLTAVSGDAAAAVRYLSDAARASDDGSAQTAPAP